MSVPLTNQNTEVNPMITEIVKLASQGFSDAQIAKRLGKHRVTITNYRREYGISSGLSQRTQLHEPKRKPKYHFKPLNQLRL